MENTYPKPLAVHWVTTTDSSEFTLLSWALTHSSLVALDAEWKPVRTQTSETTQQTDADQERTFPTVSLLQLACRLVEFPPDSDDSTQFNQDDSAVFLVDLQSVPFASIYEQLKQMFVDEKVLKLGFRFKQDLVYLSSTFCSNGFEPGFDLVEPFIDISSIYHHLQKKQIGRKIVKNSKSLAAICEELLGVSISKELQCSDWSQRPLTEEQKMYAAIDSHCLIEIFSIFQLKVDKEAGEFASDVDVLGFPNLSLGLKEVLERPTSCERIVRSRVGEASSIVGATTATEFFKNEISMDMVASNTLSKQAMPFDKSLSRIVSNYGSKIILQESDKKPKTSKKKGKKQPKSSLNGKHRGADDDWQGPPPWESLNGGDGCPKFLCDVMIEGLAKHLRCVGIDAATPYSKKPESRELIEQAQKEKRVILTRDAKLLRHDYLLENQIYRVKSLLKNEQLLEVIQTFQLTISEDRLMSRCTKCNGRFIQKPLSTDEAIEAAKGFQKIPNCLFNKNLEFWQCMDCNQLYWEVRRFHQVPPIRTRTIIGSFRWPESTLLVVGHRGMGGQRGGVGVFHCKGGGTGGQGGVGHALDGWSREHNIIMQSKSLSTFVA